jgi:PAS domain S-box-containing protein
MKNRPDYKKILPIIHITLLISFFVFVIFWEKHDSKHSVINLQEQANVIGIDLWNLDPQGPLAYLNMAAKYSNYENIKIFAVTDELFAQITGPKLNPFDKILTKAGLIPPIKLSAKIFYNGTVVGRIEVIQRHDTIYADLYLLLILGLIAMVAQYFFRTLQARDTLELRVLQRTKELRIANQQLRAGEERYREIYNAPSDAIFIHDADTGKIVDVNQGMLDMYGYTHQEALQIDMGRFSSGEPLYTLEEAGQKIQKAVSCGPQTFEWRSRKKDGTIFWTEVALKHAEFSGQHYVIAVVRDINARKQAEEDLYFTKSAIDHSTDSAFWSKEDGAFIYVNDAACRSLGYTRAELMTMKVSDFDPNFPPEAWAGHWQELKERGSASVETSHQSKDGKIFPVEVMATFMEYEGKEFNCSFVRDITERKEAEKRLAAEKERLAVTLRSIGDGVITTDTNGNVVFLNKVAESLTGWRNEEADGQPLTKVFHIINEHTKKICENPAAKVISSGQIIGLANHTVLLAKDGRELSIADSGAPILDTEGNIIGVVLVFRDVTEQIKTEREIHKVKKLESVGVLAGGIAHDFNNILAAILGNINLAILDKDLNDKTKELLSAAEKASIRAKDLTQQLLTFAKGGEPVKEAASLESVIKDSADFVLHGDRIACRYDIPDNLWLVDVDRGQMSQVIQNIVINAKHAMPAGGNIKIKCENITSEKVKNLPFTEEVQPRLYANKKFVKINITDTGVGIPADILEKIFDPYFSTKEKGSGLGLAISQSIISKHNGHISAESSPGVGSTFTIYLPSSEKSHKKKQQKQSSANQPSSPAKILVMDDEAMVRNVAKAMLVHMGHEVVLSDNGEDTLRLYQNSIGDRPFELVIMDLTIPGGMGGKEAVQKLLNIDPAAKVVVSSGYSNDPIMANFKKFGFCAKVEKPYKLQELSRVITNVIDRKKTIIKQT